MKGKTGKTTKLKGGGKVRKRADGGMLGGTPVWSSGNTTGVKTPAYLPKGLQGRPLPQGLQGRPLPQGLAKRAPQRTTGGIFSGAPQMSTSGGTTTHTVTGLKRGGKVRKYANGGEMETGRPAGAGRPTTSPSLPSQANVPAGMPKGLQGRPLPAGLQGRALPPGLAGRGATGSLPSMMPSRRGSAPTTQTSAIVGLKRGGSVKKGKK